MVARTAIVVILGAMSLFGSFFLTLYVIDRRDTALLNSARTPSERVIGALNSGRTVVIALDKDGAEERNPGNIVACGPEAETTRLGTFVSGATYQVSYSATTLSWTVSGPSRVVPFDARTGTCGVSTASYGPAQLGQATPRPDDGKVVAWGSIWNFDSSLAVFDQMNRRIGRIMPPAR